MHHTPADTSKAVEAFMAALAHPAKDAVALLRTAILASDASITEGVKWNAPSFKVDDYFATVHLRTKVGVGLVLHFGAKVRAMPAARDTIADPEGMLKWVAQDRATIAFQDAQDVRARTPALQAVIRLWIRHL